MVVAPARWCEIFNGDSGFSAANDAKVTIAGLSFTDSQTRQIGVANSNQYESVANAQHDSLGSAPCAQLAHHRADMKLGGVL